MNQLLTKLKILLKFKYWIFLFIITLSLIRVNKYHSVINENETNFVGIVESYKYQDNYTSFTIKSKEKIKCNYNSKIDLEYGDKVYLTGRLSIPRNNEIFNLFNNKKYLNNNGIYYTLKVTNIYKVKRSKNLIYRIKNYIQRRIDKYDNKGYLNAFLLGNKNYIDSEVYDTYYKNGITHIFSISGMHISLLATIILIVLNRIHKSKRNIIIVIVLLIFYLVITNYSASVSRSVVFFSILNIFKYKRVKLKLSDISLLSISFILLIYPRYVFNTGFLYSSSISFSLIYFSNKFSNNYLKNIILASIISFLVSLPISTNLNYSVNFLSILINVLFIPLITFIIYPLSLLTFIFPFLMPIFNNIITIMESISLLISKVKVLSIAIPKLNIYIIILYYFILILVLNGNKKMFIILCIMIIVLKYYTIFDSNKYIYFLSVGQGDMIIYKDNKYSIMIDTGPPSYDKNYTNLDNYIKFLNSVNINQINYLVLSHGDADHAGEAINLVNNFKVEKVIFNCGEFNDLEQELISVLDKKKIKYYSCIKELNIDNNKLYFLQTEYYDNENDNSNVIYTELDGYKFMFMGDAGIDKEKDILDKYNLSDMDVLKVGHHGSKTSSSKEFIDEINPKYSIISVGKNNRYGHPNNEVLNNLENSKIYRTDQDGSIMFKIKNNKLKIETCSP